MKVTPAAYGHLIHSLMSFAEGRVGVFLEGGKNFSMPFQYVLTYLGYIF